MSKNIGLLLLICCVSCVLCIREYTKQANGTLQWYVPYIGQGDAMLLITPSGNQIIIDGGPNTDLLSFLGTAMPWFDRSIELLIISHPDADHITALPELLRRYTVKNILCTGINHSSFKKFGKLLLQPVMPTKFVATLSSSNM